MFEKTIPSSEEARARRGRFLKFRQTALAVSSLACALLAIGALIAVVVFFFVNAFGNLNGALFGWLAGGTAVGAAVFAFAAFGLAKLGEHAETRRNDFLERCDSPESFFVGDGTLATFSADALVLHAAENPNTVRIPYGEMRVFSICTRKRPREKGTWSVVFEIPSHYLSKEGKGQPPALVQTDAKPRLYETLEKFGLPLLGEQPQDGPDRAFHPLKTFWLPNAKKRKTARILLIVGIVLFAAGIPAAILWEPAVGALLSLIGLMLTAREGYVYFRARALLAFYSEGMYWRESEGTDHMFLKWEEIEEVRAEDLGRGGTLLPVLTVRCAYGEHRFPRPAGAWEYLEGEFPEKISS